MFDSLPRLDSHSDEELCIVPNHIKARHDLLKSDLICAASKHQSRVCGPAPTRCVCGHCSRLAVFVFVVTARTRCVYEFMSSLNVNVSVRSYCTKAKRNIA